MIRKFPISAITLLTVVSLLLTIGLSGATIAGPEASDDIPIFRVVADNDPLAPTPSPIPPRPPVSAIVGDQQLEAGELGILTLTVDTKVAVWAAWPELRLLVIDHGRQVAFATRKPGVYCFDVATDGPCLYRHVVTVKPGDGKPQPTPTPEPQPNPPAPPTSQRLWLITVWESGEASRAQAKLLTSPAIKQLCETRQHQQRLVDRDNPATAYAPWVARAAGKPLPYLFLATLDGAVLWENPLPATEAEVIALLHRYGGKP